MIYHNVLAILILSIWNSLNLRIHVNYSLLATGTISVLSSEAGSSDPSDDEIALLASLLASLPLEDP